MARFFDAIGLDTLTIEGILRIVGAIVVGALVGWERERGNRPAGLRTHILVCLGACLVMTAGEWYTRRTGEGDALRLGAQVISGIGFLGAGTIIKESYGVRGLTTAASLWVVACIGLALGMGFYWGAIVGAILTYAALVFFKGVEERAEHIAGRLHLRAVNDTAIAAQVVALLNEQGVWVTQLSTVKKDDKMLITVSVHYPKGVRSALVAAQLMEIPGMEMSIDR